MADQYIALDEPSVVDKKLDTEELTVGANTVQRERVQVAGAGASDIAVITNSAPTGSQYGILVRTQAPVEGAGAVTSRTPRTTLASDDPAVTSLQLIDDVVKAEDAASASGDKGLVILAKRSDTPAVTSDTDGDYEPLQVKAGKLAVDGSAVTQPVSAASLPLPTGAATSAKQDTEIASLASIDGKITAVNTGAVVVSSSALPSGASTAAKQPALGTAGTAASDVLTVQGIASMTALKVDGSAVTQPVSLASVPSHAVTNAGTFAVQAAAAGDVAHDAADSGNPVKVGGKAVVALPTAVAAGDRTNLLTDVYGRPFVRHGAQGPAATQKSANHSPAANTKATITVAAAGAGIRTVVTGITATACGGATAPTAAIVNVALIDGASGGTTYLWGPHPIALPAVAGAMAAFVLSGRWFEGTQNTAMTLEFSAALGANTTEAVSFEYCQIAE